MRNIINWKVFSILSAACAVASVLVIPYQLALMPELAKMGIMLYFAAFAQGLILFSIITFFGLLLAKKLEFKLPVLEGKIGIRAVLKISVALGILSGVLILLCSFAFEELSISAFQAPAWTGFLASFYGGIAEEVLCRLFVMTFIVWIISKFTKNFANWGVWAAIIVSAVLFGVGHLPMTSALADITFMVVARAILLNGIGGVVFGWLYWKRGLESAIIAHFSADIVLHVVTPIVVKIFI